VTESNQIPCDPHPGTPAADAVAYVLLADFAAADAGGKLNIIGAGWAQTARNVLPGRPQALTPAQTVVAIIELPPQHASEQFAIAIQLVDERGDTVVIANPLTGQASPIRVQQLAAAEVQVGVPPSLAMPARAQAIFGMPNGLPLEANRLYRWILEIDGYRRPEWAATFYVRPDPSSPVVG
jgi:hypothetical protein